MNFRITVWCAAAAVWSSGALAQDGAGQAAPGTPDKVYSTTGSAPAKPGDKVYSTRSAQAPDPQADAVKERFAQRFEGST